MIGLCEVYSTEEMNVTTICFQPIILTPIFNFCFFPFSSRSPQQSSYEFLFYAFLNFTVIGREFLISRVSPRRISKNHTQDFTQETCDLVGKSRWWVWYMAIQFRWFKYVYRSLERIGGNSQDVKGCIFYKYTDGHLKCSARPRDMQTCTPEAKTHLPVSVSSAARTVP